MNAPLVAKPAIASKPVGTDKKHPGINGHVAKSAPNILLAWRLPRVRTVAQKKVEGVVVDRRKLSAVPSRNGRADKSKPKQDRIVTMVRDPYWLHVYWEITPESIQRTEAALGPDWYTAKPILRVLDVSSEDTTSSAESVLRDIPIHGGVNNWYLDVDGVARSYRVDVGYIDRQRSFFRPRSLEYGHPAQTRGQR